jgi:hypothetical protein
VQVWKKIALGHFVPECKAIEGDRRKVEEKRALGPWETTYCTRAVVPSKATGAKMPRGRGKCQRVTAHAQFYTSAAPPKTTGDRMVEGMAPGHWVSLSLRMRGVVP